MVLKIEYNYEECQYPYDIERIVKVAILNGVILSAKEAEKAWEEHSDDACAQWLGLPKDDEDIWYALPSWARGE
jgi:hypothetical protein